MSTIRTYLRSILLFLFFAQTIAAQNDPYLDSLRHEITLTSDATTQFELLCQLHHYSLNLDPKATIPYAEQALSLAKQFDDPVYRGKALHLLALSYIWTSDFERLEATYQAADQYLQNCDEPECVEIHLKLMSDYAFSYNDRGEHQRAIQLFLALLDHDSLSDYHRNKTQFRLAQCYLELGDYDQGLTLANYVLEFGEQSNDNDLRHNAYFLIAWANRELKRYEQMLAADSMQLVTAKASGNQLHYKFALSSYCADYILLGRYEAALTYAQQQFELCRENPQHEFYVQSLVDLTQIYIALDQNEAEYYTTLLLELLEANYPYRTIHSKTNMYYALTEYALSTKNYRQALDYAYSQLRYVRQHQSDTAELVVISLEQLSRAQAKAGLFQSAYQTLDTFHTLKMVMTQRNQEEATARAAIQLELNENKRARAQAESTLIDERQQATTRQRYLIAITGLIGLLLFFTTWAYRRAQANKKQISDQHQLIHTALEEKEILLREIHHRVKNNLQIISGLLEQQARNSGDTKLKQLVQQSQKRIQSMSLVHQNLYQSHNLSKVQMRGYLQELTTNIQRSQSLKNQNILLETTVDDVAIDIDIAIPIGLILTELLSNAYKYAFPEKAIGKIKVAFQKTLTNGFELRVEDDGIGIQAKSKEPQRQSLGLSLVNGLVRQFGGTLEWPNSAPGTTAIIRLTP